jgi:hypothetical protein
MPIGFASQAASPECSFAVARAFDTHERWVARLNGMGLLAAAVLVIVFFLYSQEAW